MKHKKTLALIILSFIVYVIYACFHTNKLNYLALGDSLSVGINSYGEEIYSYSVTAIDRKFSFLCDK